MGPADKETLRQILEQEGVNPDIAPSAWNGKTRAQALGLGHNEKLARDPVKRRRVAVKSLRLEDPLCLGGEELWLPSRCHVEIDFLEVSVAAHDWIVVVENWECFNDIHVAADRLRFPGRRPLVAWRGDSSGTRADALLAWLELIRQPVAAFVDYDPAGLAIAASLPRLGALVAPSAKDLRSMVLGKGLEARFLKQLPMYQSMLDDVSNPHLAPTWQIIRSVGKALPQEWFVLAN